MSRGSRESRRGRSVNGVFDAFDPGAANFGNDHRSPGSERGRRAKRRDKERGLVAKMIAPVVSSEEETVNRAHKHKLGIEKVLKRGRGSGSDSSSSDGATAPNPRLFRANDFPSMKGLGILNAIECFETTAAGMGLTTPFEWYLNAQRCFGRDRDLTAFHNAYFPKNYRSLKKWLIETYRPRVLPQDEWTIEKNWVDTQLVSEGFVNAATKHDLYKVTMIAKCPLALQPQLRQIAYKKYNDFLQEGGYLWNNHKGNSRHRVSKAENKEGKKKSSGDKRPGDPAKGKTDTCGIHQRYGPTAWSCKGPWCSMYPPTGVKPDDTDKVSNADSSKN